MIVLAFAATSAIWETGLILVDSILDYQEGLASYAYTILVLARL